MSKKPTPTTPSLEERMKAKRAELVAARTRQEQELNGIVNQIYIIDQLLDPKPPPDAQEDSEEATDGVKIPDGTV